MTSTFALLMFFLVIGLFSRAFNNRTRFLLIAGIVGLLIYLYLF
jgi:hypothetical protein